jgi:type II secretory pathway pseudopilin PulG
MRKLNMGWMMALALGLAMPSFSNAVAGTKSKASKAEEAAAPAAGSMSKDEQEKLKEHNKLRTEIKKVKYPAAKADIVAHVKGLKADDKKWFADTLPDKTYGSADDVFNALGWETAPAAPAATPSK